MEVNDRKSLAKFIGIMREDIERNMEKWENSTLESFLEAMQAYTKDIHGYYSNMHPEVNADAASWRVFSDILWGATMYE